MSLCTTFGSAHPNNACKHVYFAVAIANSLYYIETLEDNKESLYFTLLLIMSSVAAILVCILIGVVVLFCCYCRQYGHLYSKGETFELLCTFILFTLYEECLERNWANYGNVAM